MSVEALRLRRNPPRLELLDQRLLPASETYLELDTGEQVATAIERMAVRGAPAIGIAAAMGLALDLVRAKTGLAEVLAGSRARLLATRPTAVNLAWALERMARELAPLIEREEDAAVIGETALELAEGLQRDDVARCRAIGEHGRQLVPNGASVLTHCNAGALATGGYGTALGVIRSAASDGRVRRVLASETRPFLQGARLTAYELLRDGIPVLLITDGMSGALMRAREIDVVVVGADRIAGNGDVANKIGTYTHAALARRHGIPFYVAAPLSTVDLGTACGDDIPIEQRSSEEVVTFEGRAIGPPGVAGLHPAFDVTPAELVDGIVTERGIARPPYADSLAKLLRA